MRAKKEYNGMYLGIVIQNNDPDRAGKVKVYIPHVTPNVYEDWYSNRDHKKFKFPGDNLDSDLTNIIEPLKEILPWASSAQPLIGSSSSGRYHAYTQTGSVSDANNINLFTATSGNADTDTDNSLNVENIGESPGRKYEYKKFRLKDAFNTHTDNVNRVNIDSHEYIPSTYSNNAKGTFSIPNVGAHVWCFFRNGDPLKPVYFAVSFGQDDWHGIYDIDSSNGIDYPGAYENKSKNETEQRDTNTDTYRNKFVFNQKAGSLEFVNTDNKEVLKLTHYSGSFKEFNNSTTSELATSNNQKLVLRDEFNTINGYYNLYIGRDSDNIIRGDRYKKIGSLNREFFSEWKRIIRPIADLKQLFEIQRAEILSSDILPAKTSSKQVKTGTPALCPVCNSSYTTSRYKGDTLTSIPFVKSNSNQVIDFSTITSLGGGKETSSPSRGSLLDDTCPVCNGTGNSTSSMLGDWQADINKDKITELLPEVVSQLVNIESKMGLGGSEIIDIAKDKVETIGLAMNDFGSIRIDTKGKMYNSKMMIVKGGTVPGKSESPLLEYVHVDDLPGGSYTLNVCNKFNCQVGSGGIKMRTSGPVEVSGTITTLAGEQVNISSEHEINIDGGKRLSIVADILQIRQRKGEQVLVDSNLGVKGNVIIGGGMHVEGELSCHHITAPVEIQETELTQVFAKLLTGLKFNANISKTLGNGMSGDSAAPNVGGSCTITVTADSNDNKVRCYDHSHHFKNIPLTLTRSNDKLREVAKPNMSTDINQSDIPSQTPASKKVI